MMPLPGPFEILIILVIAVVAIVSLAIYLLPAIIAGIRGHKDTVAISLLTVLLGWSLIAWIIALIWAKPRT